MKKLCKDCKYFKEGYSQGYCHHPENLDLVDGSPKSSPALLREDRYDSISCGEKGKQWEPKPEPEHLSSFGILYQKLIDIIGSKPK